VACVALPFLAELGKGAFTLPFFFFAEEVTLLTEGCTGIIFGGRTAVNAKPDKSTPHLEPYLLIPFGNIIIQLDEFYALSFAAV